jgi:hypothetical protein
MHRYTSNCKGSKIKLWCNYKGRPRGWAGYGTKLSQGAPMTLQSFSRASDDVIMKNGKNYKRCFAIYFAFLHSIRHRLRQDLYSRLISNLLPRNLGAFSAESLGKVPLPLPPRQPCNYIAWLYTEAKINYIITLRIHVISLRAMIY